MISFILAQSDMVKLFKAEPAFSIRQNCDQFNPECALRLSRLQLVEFIIMPSFLYQLVMSSHLDDLSFVQHANYVGVLYSWQSMSYDYASSISPGFIQGLLHYLQHCIYTHLI